MELYYTPRARHDLVNIKESVIEKFDDENLAIEVLKDYKDGPSASHIPVSGTGAFRDNRNIHRVQVSFL